MQFTAKQWVCVSHIPTTTGILLKADAWQFLFDLRPEQLLFPPEVATTTLRPDGVFYSLSTKNVILLELTVAPEDRVHAEHDRKKSKYIPLASICEENGFRVHLIRTEVGCLGYCPHSLLKPLEALCLPRSTARHIRTECSSVALRCSYLLYLLREMGLVRITSWYLNYNGSHFGLPPSLIHRMTGLPPKIV